MRNGIVGFGYDYKCGKAVDFKIWVYEYGVIFFTPEIKGIHHEISRGFSSGVLTERE